MTLPLPFKPLLPLPRFDQVEPLFPDEPVALCAGPRRPDATWTRTDGKRVEVWLERQGRRCLLCWTLDGVRMTPSDHSSEEWAKAELERWQERDTLTAVLPKVGDKAVLDSGLVVELIAFEMGRVWRTTEARRCWVVQPLSGRRKRFSVTEAEVIRGIEKHAAGGVIDLMAALKASLAAKQPGPGAA